MTSSSQADCCDRATELLDKVPPCTGNGKSTVVSLSLLLRLQIIVCYCYYSTALLLFDIHRYSDLRVFWNLAAGMKEGGKLYSSYCNRDSLPLLNLQPTSRSQGSASAAGFSPPSHGASSWSPSPSPSSSVSRYTCHR